MPADFEVKSKVKVDKEKEQQEQGLGQQSLGHTVLPIPLIYSYMTYYNVVIFNKESART